MLILTDGKGSGYQAQVTKGNALQIIGETHHLQHHYSRVHGQAYQVLTTVPIDTTGSISLIHLTNDSPTLYLGVTYMRLQGIGIANLPSENEYVSIGLNSTYLSGGSQITPVNMNASSGNTANVTAYTQATVGSSLSETDRWYIEPDAAEERYEKWGSLILGQNDTMEMRLTTSSDSGLVKTRITFVMFEREI